MLASLLVLTLCSPSTVLFIWWRTRSHAGQREPTLAPGAARRPTVWCCSRYWRCNMHRVSRLKIGRRTTCCEIYKRVLPASTVHVLPCWNLLTDLFCFGCDGAWVICHRDTHCTLLCLRHLVSLLSMIWWTRVILSSGTHISPVATDDETHLSSPRLDLRHLLLLFRRVWSELG